MQVAMWRVTILAAAACLLCLGLARADEEFDVDQTVPMVNGQAEVKLESHRIHIDKVIVRDTPSEDEVKKANDKYHSYINPVVVMTNKSNDDADVEMTLILLDEQGQEILSCKRSFEVEEDDEDSNNTVCTRGRIKTLDWPRVKQVHIVAHIELG